MCFDQNRLDSFWKFAHSSQVSSIFQGTFWQGYSFPDPTACYQGLSYRDRLGAGCHLWNVYYVPDAFGHCSFPKLALKPPSLLMVMLGPERSVHLLEVTQKVF